MLNIPRRTLALYRRQQAMLGVLAAPGVANGIVETSQQIKADLQAVSAPVEDLPDDEQRPLALTSQLAPADQRNCDRMLQKVRAFWIAGVLEPSLRSAARLSLQFEQRPDLVAQPWETLVQQLDVGGSQLPSDCQIGDVFDALGGELLTLSAPESGKTTL